MFISKRQDKTAQDKTTLLHLAHITELTDLAPQVAEANRSGPGTIKMKKANLIFNVTKFLSKYDAWKRNLLIFKWAGSDTC